MMKLNRKKLSLAVMQALSAGALASVAVHSAHGQVPVTIAPPNTTTLADVQKVPSISVTGSRIPSPNLESTSPISVITAQDIKVEGAVSAENLLNNLPQQFADYGGNISNGATGTSNANLRNLGRTRTLVLLNGRRLPPGDVVDYATDLNQIPVQLIQSVEVLTGGASAVYGSDAVAGVVNFIMRDNFEGVQGDVNYSFYNHQQGNALASVVAARAVNNPSQFHVPGDVTHDGDTWDASLLIGGNFANGRGNATVFFSYTHDQPVTQNNRDYSSCGTGSDANGLNCAGSSTSFPGRFINGNTGAQFTIADNHGGVRPYTSNDQFNFAPFNYFQRPDERYGFAAFAHYDIHPQARVYGEFLFHDDHTVAQIAPSGVFGTSVTLTADNPLLSDAFKAAMGITPTTPGNVIIARRNVEGGPRQDDIRHTSFRSVIGVKGDLFDHKWDYDVFYQTGKVIYQEIYRNDMSVMRQQQALDVISDPTTGLPVCRSGATGCVPYNIFSLGGVTQAALDFLQTPGLKKGFTSQSVQGATLSSDLGTYGVRTPWATSGVGVAFGLERRVEKLETDTDVEFSTGDLAGQGGPTIGTAGQYTVKEAFVEVRVPIIEHRPWAELLSVNGSYRYSDYSTGKNTDTYGFGAEWAPVKEYRLRGSYQVAVRAANIVELFTQQGTNLFNMAVDPCGGPTPTATLDQCLRTGLAAGKYGSLLLTNPAGQYNYLQGGNETLDPEKGTSKTVGLVFQPVKNFSGSVDYFNIEVHKVIGFVPPAFIVQQCITSGQFCDLIHRDGNGTLWLQGGGFVTATNQNLGSLKTSGVDVNLNYSYPLDKWGGLAFSFVGTYLNDFKTQNVPGGGTYDCAGLFGGTCGTPAPVWRHKARVTWSTPWSADLAVTWRHFDKVKVDLSDSNPLLAGAFNPADAELGARDYIDLFASWNITNKIVLRAGVNNVFDKDPPITNSSIAGAPFGSGNTYPQVYDALGRRIFISASVNF